ncbi:MAG: TIGR01777 family oxidoreductase [Candidatus Acidiferrales bacterium]
MRILISGSSGLVGTALREALSSTAHTVERLRRGVGPSRPGWVTWDPQVKMFDPVAAEGADAVVHLAGASIADGRWNAARKRVLRSSRVEATRHLVGELAKLKSPPKIFVSASAVGYYGNRGEEVLTEKSEPAEDFLGCLAQEWEAEALGARKFGARVVLLRFGVILAGHGGALAKMLTPFKLGAGGPIGSGRQWMSWISLPDVVALIQHALASDSLEGPLNAMSPNPVRNREFAKTLGRVLRRPAIAPLPGFVARIMLGEMADALLLASQRAVPERLQSAGYSFQHADLDAALRAVLKHA